jgi:hypothetical protein
MAPQLTQSMPRTSPGLTLPSASAMELVGPVRRPGPFASVFCERRVVNYLRAREDTVSALGGRVWVSNIGSNPMRFLANIKGLSVDFFDDFVLGERV